MLLRDIFGQSAAVEQLRRAWRQERLPHALMFTGPDGVGKKTVALALAQMVNCLDPQPEDACGVCASCRKTALGNHPDVRLIEPDGAHLKIEQVREQLQQDAYLKPMEGRRKVYVLEAADTLTPGAANSLLKILEEPPLAVMLVLITAQPFALLDTIRSRCREIRFFPLAPQAMTAWLQGKLGLPEPEALALARLSGGRPAEALRMSEPAYRELRESVLAWPRSQKPQTWAEWAKALGEHQDELGEVFGILLSWYRDLLLFANRAPRGLLLNADLETHMQEALRGETPETLLGKCRALLTAWDQVSRNVNVQLVLEVLGMSLAGAQAPAGAFDTRK